MALCPAMSTLSTAIAPTIAPTIARSMHALIARAPLNALHARRIVHHQVRTPLPSGSVPQATRFIARLSRTHCSRSSPCASTLLHSPGLPRFRLRNAFHRILLKPLIGVLSFFQKKGLNATLRAVLYWVHTHLLEGGRGCIRSGSFPRKRELQ